MLKEVIELIAVASEIGGAISDGETTTESQDTRLYGAIQAAIAAAGRHDEEKRKADQAVCLLFRAVHEMASDEESAFEMVEKAERLLGFVSLDPTA